MLLFTQGRRASNQAPIEQTADLFCGGGGVSLATFDAFERLGRRQNHLAVNHSELACETLRSNLPDARVIRARLEDIDNPRTLVPGGRLSLLTGSPCCQNHSKAAQGRPRDEQSRSTAHQVTHWVCHLQPHHIWLENVPEFLNYGPLGNNGRPIPEQKGLFFKMWFDALKLYYPNLEYRRIVCADFGDPTSRERLFIMGSLDGAPLVWPTATHGPAESGLTPWRTAADCIDWSLVGDTVGTKKARGYFDRATPRLGTNERLLAIEAGLAKFGGDPFVLRRNQGINSPESNAKSVYEPLHTITTKSTDIALIVPQGRSVDRARHRMLSPIELQRAMSFPDDYVFMGSAAEQVHMIGNAVPRRAARAHLTSLLQASGSVSEAA